MVESSIFVFLELKMSNPLVNSLRDPVLTLMDLNFLIPKISK